MATPKMEKTGTPGIYRRGGRYVVVSRDGGGKQRKQFARTLAEARDLKSIAGADVARGEDRRLSRVTFAEYAREWLDSYGGSNGHGIREETRGDYRRRLEQDAIPYLGKLRLSEIEARDLDGLAGKIASRGVAPATVRIALAPVKALLATAHKRGEIRWNPAAGYRCAFTHEAVDQHGRDQEDVVVALAEPELAALLGQTPERWRPFFEFLAHTGLRIGEAIELRWRDIDLGAGTLTVSRRFYRGRVAPPKSKYGRRTIRLSTPVMQSLWRLGGAAAVADELVFVADEGGRIDQSNLMSRVLKPAAANAGVGEWIKTPRGRRAESWVGFHTFRHTCATMLFRRGWNAAQVQRFLGHHSPAFTLSTYVHLLPSDLPQPTFEPLEVGNARATEATSNDRTEPVSAGAVSA